MVLVDNGVCAERQACIVTNEDDKMLSSLDDHLEVLRFTGKEVFAVNALKAIYHDGVVEFIEKPVIQGRTEVLIIFPEKVKKVKKIGGLFKNHFIDHDAVNAEIKSLSRDSQVHLISEAGEPR